MSSFHPDFVGAIPYTHGDSPRIAIKFDGVTYYDTFVDMNENFLPTLKMIAKIIKLKGFNKMKKAELVAGIQQSDVWNSLIAGKDVVQGLPKFK
jgi:hypothetical protein